jgi:hypothetical protein
MNCMNNRGEILNNGFGSITTFPLSPCAKAARLCAAAKAAPAIAVRKKDRRFTVPPNGVRAFISRPPADHNSNSTVQKKRLLF